jgi:hypothetical protein
MFTQPHASSCQLNDPPFVFGLELLMSFLLVANSMSEALQTTDVDLIAATQNVAILKGRIVIRLKVI